MINASWLIQNTNDWRANQKPVSIALYFCYQENDQNGPELQQRQCQ